MLSAGVVVARDDLRAALLVEEMHLHAL